ncbi:MAG: DUF4932 domain-containing protein [Candidatus Aminicenantes bacterium]|nr:DUF4932 domain-containing protein [Candidatus Aminicenantes bacterium]
MDPRIELYYILLLQSSFRGFDGAPVLTELDFPYKREALSTFADFSGHEAVKIYEEMSGNLFRFGHPIRAMLSLSDPPELKLEFPIDPVTVKMADGQEQLDVFFEHVRHFAAETNFMDFYSEHQDFYSKVVESYKRVIDRKLIRELEDYFGHKQNSYTLIAAPLSLSGGFGPSVEVSKGTFDIFYIAGPSQLQDGEPVLSTGVRLKTLFWHEFSHSFINHLTDDNIEPLRGPCDILQAEMKDTLKKMGFGEEMWDIHISDWISEHVVRGVTSRLVFHTGGENAAEMALKKEIANGFPYVREVYSSLEIYEQSRDLFPSLKDYFPEIVHVFEKLASVKQIQ